MTISNNPENSESINIGPILLENLSKLGIEAEIFEDGIEDDKEFAIIILDSGSMYRADGLSTGFLVWCGPEGGSDDWEYQSISNVALIIKDHENY